MLRLLRKNVTGEMLDTHVTKVLDTYAATSRVLRRLLVSESSIAPVATYVLHKSDAATEERKPSTTFASKEPIDMVQTNNDDRK